MEVGPLAGQVSKKINNSRLPSAFILTSTLYDFEIRISIWITDVLRYERACIYLNDLTDSTTFTMELRNGSRANRISII